VALKGYEDLKDCTQTVKGAKLCSHRMGFPFTYTDIYKHKLSDLLLVFIYHFKGTPLKVQRPKIYKLNFLHRSDVALKTER
jgi:hypothetical protein